MNYHATTASAAGGNTRQAYAPASWILLTAMLAAALAYSSGLDGPLLFDDVFNLNPVRLWDRGRIAWHDVMFGNASGALGRPVSMASFMLSAAIGSPSPLDYKLGNLVVHLACGALIYRLLRNLLATGYHSRPSTAATAALLTSLWILHPLHVSTVLYAVQRMAQLSTLFVLAGLLAYLRGRCAMQAQDGRRAVLWLFFAFPLLWALGLLSKENAAVAPLLCLVLELAYFQRSRADCATLATFYAATVLLPALAFGWVLLSQPSLLLAGYEIRDFGMFERLLSQARALVEYLGMLCFPRPERMGLFTDDFTASTGLFSPLSTAFAIGALLAASGVAIALRRKSPYLFAGWFFFLVAHAVESSILPLELYYEHRNYLPSVGLLLMLAGILHLLRKKLTDIFAYRVAIGFACLGVLACLGAMTHAQARIWSSKERIVDQALRGHPESVRARQTKFIVELNKGRYDQAIDVLRPLEHAAQPRSRLLTQLDLLSAECLRDGAADPRRLDRALADARPRLTIGEIQSVDLLVQVTRSGKCPSLDDRRLGKAIAGLADRAKDQNDDILPKWQLRYAAAMVYARGQHWQDTLAQIRLAARPAAGPEIHGLLIESLAKNGHIQEARHRLQQLAARVDHRNRRAVAALERARTALAHVSHSNASGNIPP